ncbi:MAG: hypothetical protein K6B75_08535 [Lachnospiraceae bacterium]|nr:hypothetical protein [Lachnospiraceae bacterium]
MLRWAKKLYVDESMGEVKSLVMLKKRIEHNWFAGDVYLITSPTNPANTADIHSLKNLKFPYYKRREIIVYGLAKGAGKANELFAKIALEAMSENGEKPDLKEYFKELC